MAEAKSLKEQNAWLIRGVMIAHIALFAAVALRPLQILQMDRQTLFEKLDAIALPGSAALAIIVVAVLLLLGMLPDKWRNRIIHWRWSTPLPGARAFTVVGPESSRVDMKAVERHHGPLPTDPAEQDRKFYQIYKLYKDDTGVLDSHRHYLATRDIGTITFLLFVSLPWFAWWISGGFSRSAVYGGFLLLIYLACAWAAQMYSQRMVQNVLSAASCPHERQPKGATS
ncbi:MAG: hypothetical protein QUV12_02695 [Blastomonas fulva]|nr:hypothetical protein [Blastomonas fulva]